LIKLVLIDCIINIGHKKCTNYLFYNYIFFKQTSWEHCDHVEKEWTTFLHNSSRPWFVSTYKVEWIGKGRCKVQSRCWILGFKKWVVGLQVYTMIIQMFIPEFLNGLWQAPWNNHNQPKLKLQNMFSIVLDTSTWLVQLLTLRSNWVLSWRVPHGLVIFSEIESKIGLQQNIPSHPLNFWVVSLTVIIYWSSCHCYRENSQKWRYWIFGN
jgi:hypothetical protein